jgi:hypothetical protein
MDNIAPFQPQTILSARAFVMFTRLFNANVHASVLASA